MTVEKQAALQNGKLPGENASVLHVELVNRVRLNLYSILRARGLSGFLVAPGDDGLGLKLLTGLQDNLRADVWVTHEVFQVLAIEVGRLRPKKWDGYGFAVLHVSTYGGVGIVSRGELELVRTMRDVVQEAVLRKPGGFLWVEEDEPPRSVYDPLPEPPPSWR